MRKAATMTYNLEKFPCDCDLTYCLDYFAVTFFVTSKEAIPNGLEYLAELCKNP